MKASLLPRCRAALVAAAVSLCTGAAAARDTAGPEPQRRPEAKVNRAASAAVSEPRAPSAASSTVLAAPSPAPATTPAAPVSPGDTSATAESERAKRLYALGAEAFAAQRNADAIRYFRRAAELVPSPKLTYNIGLAYEEMGDAGRALSEYRAYLEQEGEREPTRREEVLARIVQLERRLADTGVQQLRVTSEPSGATLRVAGRALGVTPWTGELTPGQHVVELELPGHAPRRTVVTLAPDHSAELALSLSPAPQRDVVAAFGGWSNVSPLTWTFLGVGAAALGGGVAFELSRASSSDAAARASDEMTAAEARGAADAKQMASLLFFGFGAGFSIAGSVLLALDLSESNEAPSHAALGCMPGFCGVAARGRF